MAIFEKTIRNKNFDKLLRKLEQEIPDSSWSANLEAGSDFKEGNARCSVRVFEQYPLSWIRAELNIPVQFDKSEAVKE